jgi:hypothetical protein
LFVSKIVQIRQLLAEKFPGVRLAGEPAPARDTPVWATGIWALDQALPGGVARGSLTEVSSEGGGFGSGLILRQLIRQAAATHQWIALIDGTDCFDPGPFDNATLEHLLWLRCKKADEAVKAADLVLRDGNLPIIALDLMLNSARELRKIPSSTWYRFQRLVEEGAAAFVAMTPTPMVSSAKHRVFLRGQLPAGAFGLSEAELLNRLVIENAEEQHEATRLEAQA